MKRTLSAWLRKNILTEDPKDYTTSVQSRGSVGIEIKRETVVDIISRFNRKATEMALSGYNVNMGLV